MKFLLSTCAVAVLISATALAQEVPHYYGFLEVVDFEGKPVSGARVKSFATGRETKTGVDGKLKKGVAMRSGSRSFSVEHELFYPYKDIFSIFEPYFRRKSTRDSPLKLHLISKSDPRLVHEQNKREMFDAAIHGNAKRVKALLGLGISPELTTTDLYGIPAKRDVPVVIFAAKSGTAAVMNTLLDEGVVIDTPETRVVLAAFLSHAYPRKDNEKSDIQRTAIRMINSGADLEAVYHNEYSPIKVAIGKGFVELLRELIAKGVSLRSQNPRIQSPVVYALSRSQRQMMLEIVELLLRAGADPNEVYEIGSGVCFTAFSIAMSGEKYRVAEYLFANGADPHLKCPNGKTAIAPLFEKRPYEKEKRERILKKLVEMGIVVDEN